MTARTSMVDIGIYKTGPNGRPTATVHVDPALSLDKLTGVLQKQLTRNPDLLKALGLKSCPACTSGMDIDIRHRFDHVLQVDLQKAE